MNESMTIAIFDLDGTLLDTLDDLHAAVNRALSHAGFPARTRDEVRTFVGNGVGQLMRRAVPDGTDGDTVAAVLRDFLAEYTAIFVENRDVRTHPYPGVLALIDALHARGIQTAVVSNKFDAATKNFCARFLDGRIRVAVGEREADGIRKKPAPDTIYEALSALGHDREDILAGRVRAVYIGDSEVDIQTARNAGIPCISVTWGYRDRALLLAHGATALADSPEAVAVLLEGETKENGHLS